jgi:hypothetical protein
MATIAENLKTIKDSTTAIKQAIIDKGGQVGDLTTYADAIANLPSGGGGGDVNPTAEKNDVTFYDYDGSILYSYTAEEFLALSEFPPLPTQKGLICQEWNWSYEEAMEYVAEYGVLDVGATYITDDGKTRLYIRIDFIAGMELPIYFSQTIANGVVIDWGDGSPTETLDGTGKVNTTHRYTSAGDYCISLDVVDGCTMMLGSDSSDNYLFGTDIRCNSTLLKAEIGNNMPVIGGYTFKTCLFLSAVSIPTSVTSLKAHAIDGSDVDFHLTTPSSVKSLVLGVFADLENLKSISISSSVINLGAQLLRNKKLLKRIVLPPNCTQLSGLLLAGCLKLKNVIIPKKYSNIASSALESCYNVTYYDFSHHTAVPTLTNTNAFNGISANCKIIVPDNLYDTWIVATNWSTYASYIIKKSDWDASKNNQ